MADRFVELNGQRVFWLFTIARWTCIPFGALGNYLCARWALEQFGRASSCLASVCWTFSPWILGYGALITTDVAAASIGLNAAYQFSKWARVRSGLAALKAGGAIGFCLLTKFTLLVLPIALILWWAIDRRRGRCDLMEVGQIGCMLLLALVIVNAGYGFEGTNQRLSEYDFVSTLLGGKRTMGAERYGNRFTATCLRDVPIPLPKNYVLGVDIQRRDFERGLPSYANGRWRTSGWWWYYIYVLAIKTPLGTLALLALAAGSWIRQRRIHDGCVLPITLAGCLLLFPSSQTGFSTHGRYIIPMLPYLVLVASSLVAQPTGTSRWRMAAIILATALMVLESLHVYPHSLSFFNLAAGGPERGYYHLADSNIAWGQDLKLLAAWLERHPEVSDLNLLHYGRVNPKLAGIAFRLPRRPECEGRPLSRNRNRLPLASGWYAIDVNYLAGAHHPVIDETGKLCFSVPASTQWRLLRAAPAYARVGYSTIIFHIR